MVKQRTITIHKVKTSFKSKLKEYISGFKIFIFLDSNNSKFREYDYLAAVNALDFVCPESNKFNSLKKFYNKYNDWLFGHFSYDLKNEIDDLKSENIDNIRFPELFFLRPELVFICKTDELRIESFKSKKYHSDIINNIKKSELNNKKLIHLSFNPVFSKKEYKKNVNDIKKEIQYGNIYEMNFCQEFLTITEKIEPLSVFSKLTEISPTPFSAFYRIKDKYLISASPERFIKKDGNKIISQPIKGTIKRGKNSKEDNLLRKELAKNPKEISENVMIVDLVRNDLSKTAKKGSVKVKELFGIYSFPQVHQMISTIESEKNDKFHNVDVIKKAFPMGSMTGAPKIKAMELIEKYEKTKRGIYSGAVGYFDPKGNFDFNVIIRSLAYNAKNKQLSFIVGGAITIDSDPEKEYEECLVKAKAILELFKSDKNIRD